MMEENISLIAVFEEGDGSASYGIKIGEHLNVKPDLNRYTIPIYITANEDISNLTINNLVVVMNENVFFPTSVSSGEMSFRYYEDTLEIMINNIFISKLSKNEEFLLCNLIGKPILGNLDTSIIRIDSAVVDCGMFNYENGFIEINCCEEGDKRLLTTDTILPRIIVIENPVIDVLKVECYCVDRGDYTLEIIDMLGNSTSITREWRNTKISERYNFDISVSNLSIGNYIIIMTAPRRIKYHYKFSKY
jgi:hypothetical protein